ncbi:HAMP domain-containing sensor histidine kinase [Paenibacillus sp. JX-17]|uniref:histidine kinase n=1 Tax=Paenibacillus lacisoli TaxID=3064525 RepID=A0ABT9CD02_9BACL|nr:HAMP domain-containing sensor histidine kinase [Paenibacillus sp. JX-17]MDO7906760.1 HAMP domain-containing sensor histidine kinase [Paenibacillus sp. JX-17]
MKQLKSRIVSRWTRQGIAETAVKFRQSLLFRYLMILLGAFILLPIVLPLVSVIYIIIGNWISHSQYETPYGGSTSVTQRWHQEAGKLDHASPDQISGRLRELNKEYPEATLFWVDSGGRTQYMLPENAEIPAYWSAGEAIRFMKQAVQAGDPFTVVAFIGDTDNANQGFMVLEMPSSALQPTYGARIDLTYFALITLFILVIFLSFSLVFFIRIRRRLVALQEAMADQGENGIPAKVAVTRADEIGQLESGFNRMIEQLAEARRREREEEELRKKVVAEISHDIRTPLTVVRSHLYSLQKEPISPAGKDSLQLMESKLDSLGGMIDNLLSYNLLVSGRYTLHRSRQDILRLVRECAAAWYPLWEREGFEVDIELPDEQLIWDVDSNAIRRILDNLFQNAVRHAREGAYIGIRAEVYKGAAAVVIADRGPGLGGASSAKGAGVGLAIVELLAKEMGLEREMISTPEGTSVYLYPQI